MIGKKTIQQIKDEFGGLLDTYAKRINSAYVNNDMEIDVKLSAKLRGAGTKGVSIKAEIAFIESRVKDSAEVFVDEKQGELFPAKSL